MKKFAALFVASAAFTALSASAAQAQTTCPDGVGTFSTGATACTRSVSLSTTVADILLLTVSATTASLGNPTSANYGPAASYATGAAPLVAAISPNVKVVANKAFQVSIAATTSTFGPGTVAKPASDVQWGQAGTSGTFLGLTTAGAAVMSGTGTPDTNVNLTFQSRWAFERDVPGTYTLLVTLTLAAN